MPCPHPLRRHQQEALAALDRAREAGASRWWVTMPPGSGKTLVGTEVAHELGRTTVVLSPNAAIQMQWARTWDAYGGEPAGTDRGLDAGFTSLTYQSLAVFEDDEEEVAGSQLGRLHANGAALVERMREAGPLTLVLDECHHLLEVWGELLREVLDSLPDAVVLGLTATPPTAMTRREAELIDTLFGPVLYEARIPALVREGILAPYAELAWLTTPTADESRWLAEQATRFAELTSDLFAPGFGSTPFPQWLTARFVDPVEQRRTTWEELAAREPELTDAALRMVADGLLALPAGAVLRERHRRRLDPEDWRLLLQDWLLGVVVARAEEGDENDQRVIEAVRRTLPAIGLVWTKRGIRSGRSTVDRVTARSSAKQQAVAAILRADRSSLGDDVRALVVCDHERATATSRRRLDGSAAPDPAGSALGVLQTLLADPDTAALSPLLVTGRTVAGSAETLEALREHVAATDTALAVALRVDTTDEGPMLTGPWTSRVWTAHATDFLRVGGTRALVGTRGLLGEGWDAPCVTTLVDLTTATTATAVVQTRGRALRTDPDRPEKTALIWSPVCVYEGHVAGTNDWERYVRKHRGYFTVDEKGTVVDGVAGVDARFGNDAPPPTEQFDAIDAAMLVRAERREEVRENWQVGQHYEDRTASVVRVRRDPTHVSSALAAARVTATGLVPWSLASRRRPQAWPAWTAALLAVLVVAVVLLGLPPAWLAAAAVLVVLGAACWGRSRLLAASRHPVTVGLVAASIADGLQRAGLSAAGADDLHGEVTTDGEETFRLDTDDETSAVFAAALEEAVSPMSGPRYVVRRDVTSPPRGVGGLLRGLGALTGRVADGEVWHTVPAVLATTRDRADAYAAAWDHWVGGGPAVYAGSPEGAGVLATHRGLDPFDVTCVVRRVWR
ncbi:DEAD/DEAH box helicase [Nocardioides mangrovicus]|uniref:DEAD/DEAH box helicase n=1 Tax=Nocardioides mangrovicus TaxID=2478913 RepID=A0A3L8P6J1_9ACTN|nr:DEAD/DEAH box helicase family protein [Nocardioides mangrovicus]RLV50567.1 DEAD/DEAH box helicase [Nocardioides mangrovicus]